MDTTFDRMLWLPKSEIDVNKIKSQLTVRGEAYIGKGAKLRLYEETETEIGVPRGWGVRWFEANVREQTHFPQIEWPEIKCEWRPGQLDAVDCLEMYFFNSGCKYWNRGALLRAPTGSGKTLMGLAIAARLSTPALIIVHKGDLAKQWHETGEKLFPGCNIGHIQQDNWDYYGKHFVTAMAQTLHSREVSKMEWFWQKFGLVIIDECHHISTETFEYIIRGSTSRYRLGVSATFKRRDKLDFVWNWHIGDVVHDAVIFQPTGQYKQLVWETNLKDSQFRMRFDKKKIHVAQLINAIAKSRQYNDWLVGQIRQAWRSKRKVLVVSDRIDQLVYMQEELFKWKINCANDCTIGLYVGSVNGKSIKKDKLEQAKRCDIVLATIAMIGEGSDVPELDTLFLATPRGEITQILGRIRRVCENKKSLLVIDPVFATPFCKSLAAKRRKIYKELKFTEQEDDDGDN